MATVLVVDDSAVDRQLVTGLLERPGRWMIEYARNGAEAMDHMKETPPDIVVTDLLMPEMDGLELVTAARLFHPEVPVVLMTAHGSESLAMEALERGAASYVPKVQLAECLVSTVERVLALSRADRSHKRLIECLNHSEFSFCLDNEPSLIDALVDLVQGLILGMGLCDSAGRVRVGMALEQALLNALYRGNLEISAEDRLEVREGLLQGKDVRLVEERRSQMPYRDRRIHVYFHISAEEARFVIRDEGRGFDTEMIPEADDPSALDTEGGRGLILMRTFMDDVTFNAAGNEVTMVKRRDPVTAPAEAAD